MIKDKYGKVGVIMGGLSDEREVSLISGNMVLASLIKSGVDAYPFDPLVQGLDELINAKFDRVLIMLHGKFGEDGQIQAILEYLKIPYTSSGVMASAIAMDKYRTKLIWQGCDIPVAKSQYLQKSGFDYAQFELAIDLPVVVKPASGGSTIGLSKVFSHEQLPVAIELAFKNDNAILIEEFIQGDEFTITVCDGVVYPIVKIEAPSGEYDYENKYFNDETKYLCPYSLGELQHIIEKYALLGYNAIGACGVARLDFMLDRAGNIYFLEINTVPGMTPHSLVPMAFRARGIDYDALCRLMLDGAKLGHC